MVAVANGEWCFRHQLLLSVVSKLKCPVLLASEVSGYALMMKAVGKWGSRRDFQGCEATVFSTARRGRDFFSSSDTPVANAQHPIQVLVDGHPTARQRIGRAS